MAEQQKNETPPLTARQQRFVDQYLVDRNGGAAYIRAGFKTTDRATADAAASRLLRNVKVAAAVAQGEAEIAELTKVTVERIERELALIAFSDMGEFADWGPEGVTLTASKDLPAERTRCVLEVSESRRTIGAGGLKIKLTGDDGSDGEMTHVDDQIQEMKIKLHPKLDALKQLAKRHGFYRLPTGGKQQAKGLSPKTVQMMRRDILGLRNNDDDE